jgi:cephalosporin-C deacetylase-like acetyl esterase
MVRRRDFLGAIAAAPLAAQTIDYRDYSGVLPAYVRALAADAYARRNAELAKLTTRAAVEARQQWAREMFWALSGGPFEKTPLNTRTVATLDRQGYRVDKIVYESRPGFHVTANVYVPTTGNGPFPGVLFQLGHSRNGKAYDSYQRCCQGLVKLGYLVLAFDPMGQGERAYYPAPDGMTRLSSADEEHSRPGRQMLLAGQTASQMQVWDAIRSLDVLAAHPMVDPNRLASTGQSGGGTTTMMLAAVDHRLACAAVCSGNTENIAADDFRPPGATDDAEQNWADSGVAAWDRWDMLYPFAPKPLLIAASAKDFFGTYSPTYISNGREEFAKLARVYGIIGKADGLKWVETPQPHGLAYFLRLQVYNWFERWLKREPRVIDREPDVAPEPDKALWVTQSGNAVRDFGSKTPLALLREAAEKIQTRDKPRDLQKLIGAEMAHATLRAFATVPSGRCDVQSIEVESDTGVWCPAWIFIPKTNTDRVVLIAEPGGRNAAWHEGELYQELAAKGTAVCAVDVRGVGDLRPSPSKGAPGHTLTHAQEEDYAWAGLVFGRPLVGQRVTDLLAFAKSLATKYRRIAIAGRGKMAIPALMAAMMDERIAAAYLSGMLLSYRSLLDAEDYTESFANFIPSVLKHADLPQIARAVLPRVVTVAGAVDGAGKRVAESRVRELYGNSVKVSEGPGWNVEALSQI